ncbi:hypothetical protein LV84_03469 [Algoriphagus ratkowskyi]|uniref:Uncharacterized protein n=1 Tax=Algoriphagus ratkowskyi TaxID=57028 RepID=A0A2W7QVA9_9BACT|nr:hypothetical protein [Algoriphagus ratkowskyi]PZX52463.1 hypothetical protein LV84_03469 [Algoriphagus ratkowskyi]TXD76193.1 hypothetical protein ESW18_17330 [Algoriphagus ratkowskyi]
MDRGLKINFRKEVLKALHKEIINRVEAKECLNSKYGNSELPLFFDFEPNDPLKAYIEGMEKMNLILPLFRLNDSI